MRILCLHAAYPDFERDDSFFESILEPMEARGHVFRFVGQADGLYNGLIEPASQDFTANSPSYSPKSTPEKIVPDGSPNHASSLLQGIFSARDYRGHGSPMSVDKDSEKSATENDPGNNNPDGVLKTSSHVPETRDVDGDGQSHPSPMPEDKDSKESTPDSESDKALDRALSKLQGILDAAGFSKNSSSNNVPEEASEVAEKDAPENHPESGDADGPLNKVIYRIQEIITKDGPFDAVMGIAQGAALAFELLDRHTREYANSLLPPFSSAIFICAATPWKLNQVRFSPEKYPYEESFRKWAVRVPTAHIISNNEPHLAEAIELLHLCEPAKAETYDHEGQSIVPATGWTTYETLAVIERVTAKGVYECRERLEKGDPPKWLEDVCEWLKDVPAPEGPDVNAVNDEEKGESGRKRKR